MKKATTLILLFYFLFGTFCLPMGNFSEISNLSEMYRHCKLTEDKDMSLADFITDHLINIDSLFDQHKNGDEQKPHHPTTTSHFQLDRLLLKESFELNMVSLLLVDTSKIGQSESRYAFCSIRFLFRPPIA